MPVRFGKRHVIAETALGFAGIVYQEAPFRLVEILLPHTRRHPLLDRLAAAQAQEPGRHPYALAVARAVGNYFNGQPPGIAWPPWDWMDLSGLTPLQQAFLKATALIPYGETRAYREVAEAAGRPKAVRAAGTALARNPYPILIPCHRVIRSDGSCGRFGGGMELKKAMIALERHAAERERPFGRNG